MMVYNIMIVGCLGCVLFLHGFFIRSKELSFGLQVGRSYETPSPEQFLPCAACSHVLSLDQVYAPSRLSKCMSAERGNTRKINDVVKLDMEICVCSKEGGN